jgi:hypothetical protein
VVRKRRGLSGLALTVVMATAFALAPSAPAFATIARTPDATWGFDGRVNAILRVGSTVYVGGAFTHVVNRSGQTTARNHLAAIDASTGQATSWNPNANGTVYDLVLSPDGSRMYAVGAFTSIGSATRTRIAAFDAKTGTLSSWRAAGVNRTVRAATTLGSTLYLGGAFTKVGGQSRAHAGAVNATTGSVTSWSPSANDDVRAIVATSSRVYIGGWFTTVNGTSQNGLAAVDPSSGGTISCPCHPGVPVLDLATDGTRLYGAAGGPGGEALAYSLGTGQHVWTTKTDGNVQAVTPYGGKVYIGGHFTTVNGTSAHYVGRLSPTSGALDTSWGASCSGSAGIFTLKGYGSTALYAGGDFTKFSGQTQLRFAQFTDR